MMHSLGTVGTRGNGRTLTVTETRGDAVHVRLGGARQCPGESPMFCGRIVAALLLTWSLVASATYAAPLPIVGMIADPSSQSVTLFDMNTDTVLGSVLGLGDVLDCSLDSHRNLAFVGDFAHHIWAVDTSASPPALANGVNPIAASINTEDTSITSNGQFLLSCDGGNDQGVSVIDLTTRTEVADFPIAGGCTGVEVCAGNSVLVVEGDNGRIRRLALDMVGRLTDTGETLSLTGIFNVACGNGGHAGVAIGATLQSFTIPGLAPVDSRSVSGGAAIAVAINSAGDRVYARRFQSVAAFTFNSANGALGASPLFTISVAEANTYFGVDQLTLNPAGTKLYVTENNAVRTYSASTGVLLGTITAPSLQQPAGICAPASVCGNGVLEGSEECDDGNLTDGDGCDSNCTFTACGNGIVTAGEECDDGNTRDGDCCSSSCTAAPDDTLCDDLRFCNGADRCASGACTVHSGDPCLGGPECNNVCDEATDTCFATAGSVCTDDGNPCTSDQCDGLGACTHPDSDFASCDDGLFCNGSDFCLSGTCSFHVGDPCMFDTCNAVCDETNAVCDPSMSGTPCFDDDNVCTLDECDGTGSCAHPPGPSGVACPDDGNVCTIDQCDAAGACAHAPGPSGVFCPDDGNVCTIDRCDGSGVCAHTPGSPGIPCPDDGNLCTIDQCDASGTCTHSPGPSGVPCPDDGSPCTKDLCDGVGACGHPPLPSGTACPDDGNDCTNDQCDGAGFCAHPALLDGTTCDDSDACTRTDSCQAGLCIGADPVVCATVPCHEPTTCDHTSGTCTNCPAGYAQGSGGCQKTYAIDASLLDDLPNSCDALDRYQCGSPFGFHWIDTADADVGAPTQVDVLLNTGLDCTEAPHTVTLDTTPIGVYASTAAAACNCMPLLTPRLLSSADTAIYGKGGLNEISISTTGCAGLSPDANGHYAVVTVTYEDPGLMVVMQSGCRQAGKSRFKYTDSVTDTKDKLQWKWSRGATTVQQDFGDPTASADYQFCVFAETSGTPTVLFAAAVPADASRWSALGTVGYKYLDKTASQDGMSEILVHGGAARRSKIILRGRGAGLSDPALPLAPADGIRVQLTNESTGICWESEFPVSAIGGGIHASAP